MQIIPATGQGIAADLGWPDNYTLEDLYRPLVNLKFGADYLDHQRETFDGDLYAALAAYNGGPENSRQWLKLREEDEISAWVNSRQATDTREQKNIIEQSL